MPLSSHMRQKPKILDTAILSFFVILITCQPYFLYGKINIFEVGLYLPGIDALFRGLVPYRDFFHLRGPFELYMPAMMMAVFGKNISVLSMYFYIGTILTLLICVFLGKELYKTRFILYLMVPVLVGRTFPRVVFTFWGGMRYAFGLLALLCAVKFFKQKSLRWIFFAGVASALAIFTSIDVGACCVTAVIGASVFSLVFKLQNKKEFLKSMAVFFGGIAVISVPYLAYLWGTQSLIPFFDSVYAVVINFPKVINTRFGGEYPTNIAETLQAMFVPTSKNFRQMTPIYLYLIVLGYLYNRFRKKEITSTDTNIVCIGIYGAFMFYIAFRNIWTAQFEMALQPEKILFFFILEEAYLFFLRKKEILKSQVASVSMISWDRIKVFLINFLIVGLFMSSISYAFSRYHKRFFSFQCLENVFSKKNVSSLKPLSDEKTKVLTIERAKGLVVPEDQAKELEAVNDFVQKKTKPSDIIFTFPEIGTYNFFFDRPFLGRFPLATFSWFKDEWYKEFIVDLKMHRPKYTIVSKYFAPNWEKVYFAVKANRKKYDEMMQIILTQYTLEATTPESYIYKIKDKN